jgi:formylglycine-generating enzyme required for sulfatase activity
MTRTDFLANLVSVIGFSGFKIRNRRVTKHAFIAVSHYRDTDESPSVTFSALELALEKAGFEIQRFDGCDKSKLRLAVESFCKAVTTNPDAVCMFYFSGYVLGGYGSTFIVPTGLPHTLKEDSLASSCVPLSMFNELIGETDKNRAFVVLDNEHDYEILLGNPDTDTGANVDDLGPIRAAEAGTNNPYTLIVAALSGYKFVKHGRKSTNFLHYWAKYLSASSLKLGIQFLSTDIMRDSGGNQSILFLPSGSEVVNASLGDISKIESSIAVILNVANARVSFDGVESESGIKVVKIADSTKKVVTKISVIAPGKETLQIEEYFEFGKRRDVKVLLLDVADPTVKPTKLSFSFDQIKYRQLAEYCNDIVHVPPASFIMGDNKKQETAPEHIVNLSQFHIGRYPVTRSLWTEYCAAVDRPLPDDPGWEYEAKQPVVNVSWLDIAKGTLDRPSFCDWVSSVTGLQCRLPTEAEFEYCAGLGTRKEYPWGDEFIASNLIYRQNSRRRNHPVNRTMFIYQNKLGLLDMIGNVREWCGDNYGAYPAAKVVNPAGPSFGEYRCVRGASWSTNTLNGCSVWTRGFMEPDRTVIDIGFRVVLLPK